MIGIIDTWIVYRVLRILTTPWDEMDAFRHGIIDATGKVLRKQTTLKKAEEKKAYTFLHRLVFNLKRILEKLPFGKTKLARYATALFLLREHMQTEQGKALLEESFRAYIKRRGETVILTESEMDKILKKGRYRTIHPMFDADFKLVKRNTIIVVPKDIAGQLVLGTYVFEVISTDGHRMAVSREDIEGV